MKRKFLAGEQVKWVLLDLMSPDLVEILGAVGVDGVMMEGEHAAYNEDKILSIVRTCDVFGMTPVIRLRTIQYDQIGRLLDLGVQGIHATHVRSRADVEHLIRCTKYPPVGERGWGQFARVNGYGLANEAKGIANGNDEVLLSVCIEDIEGAEAIEEICGVEGIDSIAIGPSDLSASMGIPGDYKNPEFVKVRDSIEHAISKSYLKNSRLFGGAPNVTATGANYFTSKSYYRYFGGTIEDKQY